MTTSATERVEGMTIGIEKDRGEVKCALKAHDTKITDNWDSSQRQMNAVRSDITELKISIKDGNVELIREIGDNNERVLKALSERK